MSPDGIYFVGYTDRNLGSIVGFISTWDTDTFYSYPGAKETFCLGMNNARWVVGCYTDTNDKYHGFLYNGVSGKSITIDVPGANQTICRGITTSGKIVGECSIWSPTLKRYELKGFLAE